MQHHRIPHRMHLRIHLWMHLRIHLRIQISILLMILSCFQPLSANPAPQPCSSLPVLGTEAIRPMRILIDPGHGGSDPGAVSPLGITEKSINLGVAKYLAMILKQRGAQPFLTRKGDEALSLSARKPENGCKSENATTPDLFISIHHNSSILPRSGDATEVYYHAWDRGPSFTLAMKASQMICHKLGTTNFSVHPGAFAVIRNSSCPAILIEGCYMSADPRVWYLSRPLGMMAEAEAIYRAILAAGIRPDRADSIRQCQTQLMQQAEPLKTEPVKTEPVKTEPAETESDKTGPVKTGPAKKVSEDSGKPELALAWNLPQKGLVMVRNCWQNSKWVISSNASEMKEDMPAGLAAAVRLALLDASRTLPHEKAIVLNLESHNDPLKILDLDRSSDFKSLIVINVRFTAGGTGNFVFSHYHSSGNGKALALKLAAALKESKDFSHLRKAVTIRGGSDFFTAFTRAAAIVISIPTGRINSRQWKKNVLKSNDTNPSESSSEEVGPGMVNPGLMRKILTEILTRTEI